MLKKIRLTEDGFQNYKQELDVYRKNRIPAITELQRAREMGDLSENAAYKVARSKLSGIDRNIRRIEGVLRRVEIVRKNMNGIIGIGSQMRVVSDVGELSFTLVDGYESDFSKGKISLHAPLGRSVIGKREGDEILVHTPKGKTIYKIIQVR